MIFGVKKTLQFSSNFVTKIQQSLKPKPSMPQRVQYNVINELYSAENQAKLRQKASFQTTVSSLQKQLKQQISKALKNAQMKLIYLISKAKKSYENSQKYTQKQKLQHNKIIEQCEKARWQFIVHRQCVGFTIKNYQLVTSLYPIPQRL